MSGRGASNFGPLHIPFKKWAAAAGLPHAHQFDQDMQRIEDWAERLYSGGGVGGPVPVMDGRRFTVDGSAQSATVETEGVGPKLEIGKIEGTGRNYSTYLTGQFDLELSAFSSAGGVGDAQYLIECWVQPTSWPELVAPIAKQNFQWGEGGKVTVHYEWMMNWFWDRDPDQAEEYYGFVPPRDILPVSLAPQIRVTWINAPSSDAQINVQGTVGLHAISMGNTAPGNPQELRPDLDQLEIIQGTPIRVPASTTQFGGGGGGGDGEYEGGPWAGSEGWWDGEPEKGLWLQVPAFSPNTDWLTPRTLPVETAILPHPNLNMNLGMLLGTGTGSADFTLTVDAKLVGGVSMSGLGTRIALYDGPTRILASEWKQIALGNTEQIVFTGEINITSNSVFNFRAEVDVEAWSPEVWRIWSYLNLHVTLS